VRSTAISRTESLAYDLDASWLRFADVEADLEMTLSIEGQEIRDPETNEVRAYKPVVSAVPLNHRAANEYDIDAGSPAKCDSASLPSHRSLATHERSVRLRCRHDSLRRDVSARGDPPDRRWQVRDGRAGGGRTGDHRSTGVDRSLQTDVLDVRSERNALERQLSKVEAQREELRERVGELEAQRPALEPKQVFANLGAALKRPTTIWRASATASTTSTSRSRRT